MFTFMYSFAKKLSNIKLCIFLYHSILNLKYFFYNQNETIQSDIQSD